MMNYLLFKLPEIHLIHNELMVKVYRNNVFESHFILPPNTLEFQLDNCESGSEYFIQLIPSNLGSSHGCVYQSDSVSYVDLNDSGSICFNNLKINGKQYKIQQDLNSNLYKVKASSFDISNTFEFGLSCDNIGYIFPGSKIIKHYEISVFDENSNPIDSFSLNNKHIFSFTAKKDIRNYLISIKTTSYCGKNIQLDIELSIPSPRFLKIKHFALPSQSDQHKLVRFNFVYEHSPRFVEYLCYKDKARSELIESQKINYTSTIELDIPIKEDRFFTFKIYDLIGEVDSHDYHYHFHYIGNTIDNNL